MSVRATEINLKREREVQREREREREGDGVKKREIQEAKGTKKG